jgi:hypothetical protein
MSRKVLVSPCNRPSYCFIGVFIGTLVVCAGCRPAMSLLLAVTPVRHHRDGR